MFKIQRNPCLVVLSILLLASFTIAATNAQSTATVNVQEATGGTTDVTGTTTYPDGSEVTITATPDAGYILDNWVVSPSDGSGDLILFDNPLTFTVTGDVTYIVVPIFSQPLPIPGRPLPPDLSNAAIVVIFPSAGGTTLPAPGTYALADASNFDLTAMPSEGWQFAYWTICGTEVSHGNAPVNWTPSENPYNVNHGYGDVYRYQAVFTPIGSSPVPTPTPSTPTGTVAGMSTETWIIIGLVVVIIVILIGVFATRRKK